jgi:hypothetical protein
MHRSFARSMNLSSSAENGFYIGLRALYAPVSKHEEQALARVHKRLAAQTRAGRETFREPVSQLLAPVTEQETLPMLLPPKRRQKR